MEGTVHLAFSAEQAADLTGLSKRQIFYWDKTGFFWPSFEVDGRRVYSFRDLVGLRTIYLLRDQFEISLQKLRQVSPWLHEHSETPWASLSIFVLGSDIYLRSPATDLVESADQRGQRVGIELERVASEMTTKIASTRQRSAEKIGKIARAKGVMKNAPVISGTRIRTEAIWNFHNDGFDVDAILEQYPSLKPADIEAAIEFEKRARREKRAG